MRPTDDLYRYVGGIVAAGVTLATFQMPSGEYMHIHAEHIYSFPQTAQGDIRVLISFRLGMAYSLRPTSITVGISTSFHLVRPQINPGNTQ